VLQELFGRKVQPLCAADHEAHGGGGDGGEHLRIEAQRDHGRARIVVGNGPHGGCWRDALG
jgi:hypothetical protein